MGYRDGLTLQSMPYDFRIASGLNMGFKRSFKKSLLRLKKLTGKKTIVMAHSFGTVNTYSAILDLTEKEKRELVDFWAPVGGPLMGNAELMGTMITGDNPLSILNGLIGLTKQQALTTFYETTFSFELLPFDYWKFVHQKWFSKFVLNRLLTETTSMSFDFSRPNFFPNPSNECYKRLQQSPITCNYLRSVFPGKKIVNLKNKSYELNQIEEFLDDLDYSYVQTPDLTLKEIYKLTRGNYREYPHPNVPVVGFFYNIKPTRSEFFFENEEFVFEEKMKIKTSIYNTGDSTVETYSAMMPMLKWAHAYSYEKGHGDYPVKFVDLCSSINRKQHPFDSNDYHENFSINSYIGTSCDCYSQPKNSSCIHADMLKQKGFIKFAQNMVMTGQIAPLKQIEIIDQFDEEELQLELKQCSHIFEEQRN
jgi:hypothetical protein